VLAARLQAEGALVRAFDPIAEAQARELMPQLEYAPEPLEAVRDADAVVLVTEWPEFIELDFMDVAAYMRGDLVIDGRNALDPQRVRAAGLTYEGIGRGSGAAPRADAAAAAPREQPSAGKAPPMGASR